MRLETSAWYALGAPLFALILVAERWLLARRRLRRAPLAEIASNLACGLGQVLCGVATGPLVLLLYDVAFAHRVIDLPSVARWPLALVGVDLCYYLFHRAGHRVAIFWCIHAVHHQSEELDLSVALRQPWLSDLTAIFFYWPLPLLGVDPIAFFAAVALLSLYQVTLHTRLAPSAGLRGILFNTPSHHRVHHGRQPRFLDKNFGATLIVWDRLFGTFQREDEPPVYGSPDGPVRDPVRAQLQAVAALAHHVRRTPGFGARLALLFGPPRALPPGAILDEKPPIRAGRVAIELGLVVAIAIPILDARARLPFVVPLSIALAALALQVRWGRMLTNRTGAID